MPQMKPMYWFLMYMLILIMFMLTLTSIFFFQPIIMMNRDIKKDLTNKWNWLW